jgi:peptidoglycan/LPS O-acetylase OafA/YrhL
MAPQMRTQSPFSDVQIQRHPLPSNKAHVSFYRPELDMLRFFAFLGVFQFHYAFSISSHINQWGAPRWLVLLNDASYGGSFGVDLFFVLSAYLITELLLREKDERGTLNLRSFYARRVLRIWPLYFFFIAVALIPFFNPLHGFSSRYVCAFVLLSGNWSFIAWGEPISTVVGPLWTVSVEEQFYLLWPPLVRKISRHRIALAALAMLVVATLTRIAMLAIHANSNSVRYNSLARLDPIAAGILVATVLHSRMPKFGLRLRLIMLCCGVSGLILVAHFWRINRPDSLEWVPTLIGYPVVAVSCTLILLAVLGVSLRFPQFLVYLGKISYGLYVYHILAMFLAWRLIPSWKLLPSHNHFSHVFLRELLGLAITVLLASISYTVLEKPFLKLKTRFELVRSRPI